MIQRNITFYFLFLNGFIKFCYLVMRLTNAIEAEVCRNLVRWAFTAKATLTCLPLEAQTEDHGEYSGRYPATTVLLDTDQETATQHHPVNPHTYNNEQFHIDCKITKY